MCCVGSPACRIVCGDVFVGEGSSVVIGRVWRFPACLFCLGGGVLCCGV